MVSGMNTASETVGMPSGTDPVMEHAVVVSLRLANQGTHAERRRVEGLVSEIEAALSAVRGGEFGGTDSRGGYCMLYCYGDDAAEIYAVVEPVLQDFGPESGSWAIKRFGSATDLLAPRERVDLAR